MSRTMTRVSRNCVSVFAEWLVVGEDIAVDDRDRLSRQPDHAFDIGLAKLLRIGIGAMEDGHFPAARAAEVVNVLVHE